MDLTVADRNVSSIEKISEWSLRYPIDIWWRQKYNIPFGSPQHMDMCILDMLYDREEELCLRDARKQKKEQSDQTYIPGSGAIFRPKEITDVSELRKIGNRYYVKQ